MAHIMHDSITGAPASILGRQNQRISDAASKADWADALNAIAEAEDEIGRLRAFFIGLARRDGMTWADIGTLFGVSGEAIRKRYRESPDPWNAQDEDDDDEAMTFR